MAEEQIEFTISRDPKYQTGSHPILTIRVDVDRNDPAGMSKAINRLQDHQLKEQVARSASASFDLQDYGIQTHGSARPVHENDDRNLPVIAYERDYKFTRNI